MQFASDNTAGASAPILAAIGAANDGAMCAYGTDELTRLVEDRFRELFQTSCHVFLVTTGTAANALALAAAVPPWGLAICHREGHVIDDECGAPEFFMHGAKLYGLEGVGAKILPTTVAAYLEGLSDSVKQMPPKALSISQATECGLVYDPDEIGALSAICRKHSMSFHMDGARFANALVALGCSPADMTWKRGIDILSFGATKNGCIMGEAIVVFDTALAESLPYRRKRAGQTLSKGRFLAAQFEAYFANDHWLDNARHANSMAKKLSESLAQQADIRIAWPTQANEVFAIMPLETEARLLAAGAQFYRWGQASLPLDVKVREKETLVRLVTSFATTQAQIDRFLETARGSLGREAAE